MPSNHKELVEELGNRRVEISKLKNALDGIHREKESWFRKKSEISAKIKELIRKIKDNKSKRDFLTNEVKELKPKRDKINKELSLKLGEFEKLKKERAAAAISLDIKESPSRIKLQMDKLEFKIETDTVSFEKEKELMKKIKKLRKDYDKLSVLWDSNKKIREVLDAVRKLRKDANEAHRAIQEKAKQSQVMHEEILKVSAEIDKINLEEEEAFRKFSEFRKQFYEVNSQLKEKLRLMNDSKSKLDRIYSDKKEKRKEEEKLFLKSKEDVVDEKIKKRQKLTTEDLLVFQQKFGKG